MSIVTPGVEFGLEHHGAPRWQIALRDVIRDPAQLLELLELPSNLLPAARRAAESFPLRVPRAFANRMRRSDPHDPLLLQVLPIDAELQSHPEFTSDPVGDLAACRAPGLLHKYRGRVLLVTSGACAIHCRYCFRREFPYQDAPHHNDAWEPALQQIAADDSIEEVLLSGGDPLTLTDARLASLTARLADNPHVQRLRIHTRLPVVIPERVDDALLSWLTGTRLQPIVVLHANHGRELDQSVARAVERLHASRVLLLNQAVLLRGVNDTLADQLELCRRLIELRVIPYYLHQLDRVSGAAHFEVPESEGLRLMQSLREQLPGYAVPQYVREVAGAPYKVPLAT